MWKRWDIELLRGIEPTDYDDDDDDDDVLAEVIVMFCKCEVECQTVCSLRTLEIESKRSLYCLDISF